MPTQMLQLKVQNVVVTADFGEPLDLASLAARLPEASFEPERFPGLIVPVLPWHDNEKPPTALFFRSGKANIVGIRNLDDVEPVLAALTTALAKGTRSTPSPPEWKVVNIVASGPLNLTVIPERLLKAVGDADFEYDFETPRSLIYRKQGQKLAILISKTGRLTVVGGRSKAEVVSFVSNFLYAYWTPLALSSPRNTGAIFSGEVALA